MSSPPPPESMAGGPPDCKPSHRRTAGVLLAVCFRRRRGAVTGAGGGRPDCCPALPWAVRRHRCLLGMAMSSPPPPESMAGGPPDYKPSHRRTAGVLLTVCFRRRRGAVKGAKLRPYPGPCPSSSHHQWRDRRDPARGGIGEAVEGMDPVRGAGSDKGAAPPGREEWQPTTSCCERETRSQG